MENNHGFAFGESNSSAVKWSVNELESDLKNDTILLRGAAKGSEYPSGRQQTLSLNEERAIQRNKLLFTKTKDDVLNEMRTLEENTLFNNNAGSGGGVGSSTTQFDRDEDSFFPEEEEEEGTGLNQDESNWLDSIGKKKKKKKKKERWTCNPILMPLSQHLLNSFRCQGRQ